MSARRWLGWAGIGAGLLWLSRPAWPRAFTLLRNAYRSVDEWANDRGAQIARAFGLRPDPLSPAGEIGPASMSADAWNRRKIGTLAGPYQSRFTAFTAAVQRVARSHGAELIIWDGQRPLARQLDLFRRGREGDGGAMVTYTMASNHILGLAADYVIRTSAGQPDWDLPRWWKTECLPLATGYGLESLFIEKGIDPPHVQVPEAERPPVAVATLRQIDADFPGLA